MKEWKYRLNIQPIIESYDGRNVRSVAKQVRQKLANSGLFEGVTFLEDMQYAEEDNDPATFNTALEDAYAYADQECIWLGNVPE